MADGSGNSPWDPNNYCRSREEYERESKKQQVRADRAAGRLKYEDMTGGERWWNDFCNEPVAFIALYLVAGGIICLLFWFMSWAISLSVH
jgi:hypothetical protein